ncbi:MAG: phosphate transport system regulatory protein PhoU [Deltaproteobacteria bacterium]|nr:MAG: phosphate transport system regulatory protein PhoU [Deltaproteobacteria bacterium]
MKRHLQVELENLKKRILFLGGLVEEGVRQAVKALRTRDGGLARKVIAGDLGIDELEVEIEEECLKVLALHQPVAVDLRFITAVIKINNDLERVGDMAVNIAERVLVIVKAPPIFISFDYNEMAQKVEAMLKMSLDSLVNLDADMAYRVGLMDDEVDIMNHLCYDVVKEDLKKTPHRVSCLINLLLVARHLERIADHATNIAEEVIYMMEGEIHRHVGSLEDGS